jgi:hypothetical protein
MRGIVRLVAAALAFAAPLSATAQHSGHGGDMGSMPTPRHSERERTSKPALPSGVLPVGSARQIEVLVVTYGFSPSEIAAEQGEEVILYLRRSDDVHCKDGLEIPARKVLVQLPVGETVPVPLKLERAETLDVGCRNEDVRASIIVAPRQVPGRAPGAPAR